MTRAVIWADSGPGVGLGHISRCCAVASELEKLGVEVELFTPDDAGESAARDAGVSAAVADRLIAILDRGAGLAIVDSYRVAAAEVDAVRSAGKYVAAFDDTAEHVLPADVVINGAPWADASHYDRQPGRRYLLGAAYFPLRPAFRAAPAKTIRGDVETVIVTVGGEDVHGLLERFMTIAAASYKHARIIGVVGTVARRADDDVRRADLSGPPDRRGVKPRPTSDVRVAPPDYADLVRDADVMICGGGQSLIEAAAVGTPAAAIVLGDDQRPQRAAVIAAGAALDGGDWRLPADERDARLRQALEQLRPADTRAHISARGRALVDGGGARRIAQGLLDAWQEA